MKAFYSILLVMIFMMHSNAKSGEIAFHQPAFILDTIDSTIILPLKDSSDIPKDSLAVDNEEAPVIKKAKSISGVASFYSKGFEGSETATGETFHHKSLTGASNNFPLNTWVRVTNLKNGKTVIVRINDRMHPKMAKKGRVVDLTITAAKKIGLTSKIGLTKVKVEQVEKGTIDELTPPVSDSTHSAKQ